MIQYFCDTILVMKIHNIIVLQNIDKMALWDTCTCMCTFILEQPLKSSNYKELTHLISLHIKRVYSSENVSIYLIYSLIQNDNI